MQIALELSFTLLLALGILMTFIPTLPGLPYMFFITLIFAFVTKFAEITPWILLLFAGIVLLSMIIDYSAGLLGAKLGGASKASVFIGFIGLIIGLVLFPPFGALIGLFFGVFVGELMEYKHHSQALKAAGYSLFTALVGAIINIALAITYFILFLIFVY